MQGRADFVDKTNAYFSCKFDEPCEFCPFDSMCDQYPLFIDFMLSDPRSYKRVSYKESLTMFYSEGE